MAAAARGDRESLESVSEKTANLQKRIWEATDRALLTFCYLHAERTLRHRHASASQLALILHEIHQGILPEWAADLADAQHLARYHEEALEAVLHTQDQLVARVGGGHTVHGAVSKTWSMNSRWATAVTTLPLRMTPVSMRVISARAPVCRNSSTKMPSTSENQPGVE